MGFHSTLFIIFLICNIMNHIFSLKGEDKYVQELAKFAVDKINKENELESNRPSLSLIRVTKVSKEGDVFDLNARLKESDCKTNCPIEICDIKISVFKGEKVLERRKCFMIKRRPRNFI